MKSEELEEGVDKRNGSFFSRFEPVLPTRHHHSGRKSPNQDDAKLIGNAFRFESSETLKSHAIIARKISRRVKCHLRQTSRRMF